MTQRKKTLETLDVAIITDGYEASMHSIMECIQQVCRNRIAYAAMALENGWSRNALKMTMRFFCFLLLVVCVTGCFRLKREYEGFGGGGGFLGGRNSWVPKIVKERFYGGVRENIDTLSQAGLFLPIHLVDLPLEVVADTLFLPKDLLLYGDYIANPPLSMLVRDNKYDAIKERLEKGENPEAMDMRTYSSSAVRQAIISGNASIYALLLEYGALSHAPYREAPYALLHYLIVPKAKRGEKSIANAKAIIRMALEHDGKNAKVDETGSSVFCWCEYLMNKKNNLTPDELEDCACIVEMLLQNGGKTNYYWEREKQTTLDIVLESDSLPPNLKERLVSALRLYGGLKYEELPEKMASAKPNAAPKRPMYPKSTTFAAQLEKEPIEIDPMFNNVVEFLKSRTVTGYFKVSNCLLGLSCPALVVELGWGNGHNVIYRQQINIHRRTGPASWNMQSEMFERPIHERLVFTPPGVVIPSRIVDNMPNFLLREAWASMPECECYYERNADPYYKFRIGDAVLEWAKSKGAKMTNTIKMEDRTARSFHFHSFDTYMQLWPFKITQADKDTMEKAAKASKEAGVKGDWFRVLAHQGECEYVFTTHRQSIEEFRERRCPYPDEVFCFLDVPRPQPGAFFERMNRRQNKLKLTRQISLEGIEGKAYWNYASVFSPRQFTLSLFFGDEVSAETVERLQKALLQKLK